MINKLTKLANYLDNKALLAEADELNMLIKEAGRLERVISKYPNYEEKIRSLFNALPQRLLKYFPWAAEELIEGPETNIEELASLLGRFEDLKNTKAIKEQIPNLQDYPVSALRRVIKNYGLTSKEERHANRAKRDEESSIIYNSENFMVILPNTQFASCQWTGKSTKWCISAEESNMYNSYANDNVFLYHILNKSKAIPDKNPLKRISIPTKGDLGILESEVRDSTDEHIGELKARESVGEEFDAIKQSILSHSAAEEFTANVNDKTRDVARKIKNNEIVSSEELSVFIKQMSLQGDATDSYWIRLIEDSLSSGDTLVSPILSLGTLDKRVLSKNLFFILQEEEGKDAAFIYLFGITGYMHIKYETDEREKLKFFSKFFNKDAEALEVLFPHILNELLSFKEGKSTIADFVATQLTESEIPIVMRNVKDESILSLYRSMISMSLNTRNLDIIAKMLIDRGAISAYEHNEDRDLTNYDDELPDEYYDEWDYDENRIWNDDED